MKTFYFGTIKKELAVRIFTKTAKTVSAYKTFLALHGISVSAIRTMDDFTTLVPVMEKDNYLRAYPLHALVPYGSVPPVISASSGSSGKPFYWPRGEEQEIEGGKLHERIFRKIFKIGSKKTLVVVCFSMGNWIAGTFTAASCRYVAKQRGINLSIITPGIEKEDILAIIRDFAPQFETVILAGYPPFMMDIISESNRRAIPLTSFQLKFLFAGENFSEHWREVICQAAGVENTGATTVSVYGSADAGALGNENPLTIAIRKHAALDQSFSRAFFGDIGFVPSLVQYDPEMIHFELINGQLAFTIDGGIPLVRYNIKDEGLVMPLQVVIAILKEHHLYDKMKDLVAQYHFPMVALFGRSDVAVTFYALNIYPENISAGIEGKSFSGSLTGKFIAQVALSKDETTQKLIINFELAKDVIGDNVLANSVQKALVESLIELNAEYRKLYGAIHEQAIPTINLVNYGDEMFVIKKSKHKWIKK